MRITDINIRTFGKLANRSVNDLPEGLILITGDNESGKTTMMEFMRTTMFPSSKRNLYPEATKNDSGSLILKLESGEEIILERKGKDVTALKGKERPEKMFAMDAETYNSIFAMNLADLTNSGVIEGIRNKFLTIPGGDNVPAVLSDLESLKKAIMNEERISSTNPVRVLRGEADEIGREMSSVRIQSGDYDRLVKDMDTLTDKIRTARSAREEKDNERTGREILRAQKENVNKIEKMTEQRSKLAYADLLTEETIVRVDTIRNDIAVMNKEAEGLKAPEPFSKEKAARVSGALKSASAVLEERNAVPSDEVPEPVTSGAQRSGKKFPVLPLMLFAAAAAAFAACIIEPLAAIAGIALAIGGAAVLFAEKNKNAAQPVQTIRAARPSAQSARESAVRYDVETIFREDGRRFKTIEDAVTVLEGMIRTDAINTDQANKRGAKNREIAQKNEELIDIEKNYGGRDSFNKMKADRASYIAAGIEIDMLTKSMESATKTDIGTIKKLLSQMPEEVIPENNDIDDMNRQRGALQKEIENMRSDVRLYDLAAKKDAKETELANTVKEWGVLSLQNYMIDRSCQELYKNMQPSVIRTANKYLGTMTNGRYMIDTDPRQEGINIRDGTEYKTPKQWSSGLGDQVYLSIKMAVAKEMGTERLPMVLDDILVRFDNTRKRSACEAILEFAKDQQVFLFSCIPLNEIFPVGSTYRHVKL
ncbi:MAG: AAA family ATPase [Methanomassiliicoccaceae archaeon]|jgi:hypothetical protein|nr:AAA family ATPase [Methanomassiliicoccaceae archaeon]